MHKPSSSGYSPMAWVDVGAELLLGVEDLGVQQELWDLKEGSRTRESSCGIGMTTRQARGGSGG